MQNSTPDSKKHVRELDVKSFHVLPDMVTGHFFFKSNLIFGAFQIILEGFSLDFWQKVVFERNEAEHCLNRGLNLCVRKVNNQQIASEILK